MRGFANLVEGDEFRLFSRQSNRIGQWVLWPCVRAIRIYVVVVIEGPGSQTESHTSYVNVIGKSTSEGKHIEPESATTP